MNASQMEWIRQAIISLMVRTFALGIILGQSVTAFLFMEGVGIIIILNVAVFWYFSRQAYHLYDELGTKISSFVNR